jgi:hypothetical protein
MAGHKTHIPQAPAIEDPEELDTGEIPVEPDDGIVPTHIPEDEERGRLIDPEDREPSKARDRGSLSPSRSAPFRASTPTP